VNSFCNAFSALTLLVGRQEVIRPVKETEYIIQFAGERIFKIDAHLAKLQSKWLIV